MDYFMPDFIWSQFPEIVPVIRMPEIGRALNPERGFSLGRLFSTEIIQFHQRQDEKAGRR
jgi:hypothetical protein